MRFYHSEKFTITADNEQIAVAIDLLREKLAKLNATRQEISKFCLKAEEVLALLIKNADGKTPITITISTLLDIVRVKITCSGSAFNISDLDEQLSANEEDAEARAALQNFLNKILTKQVNIRHNRGINLCEFLVHESPFKSVYSILCSLLCGIIFGFILKTFCPASLNANILKNILEPISIIFINLLKTVIAPLVFFSIASSIASFTDLKSLGRIAFKVLSLYTCTSVIALILGLVAFTVIPAGSPSLQSVIHFSEETAPVAEPITKNFASSLINLFPANFIDPFLKMDMLQIIILAVLFGIACSKISEQDNFFLKLINSFNSTITMVVNIIVSTIPLVIFSSAAKIILTSNLSDLSEMFSFVLCQYFACMLLFGFYSLLLLLCHYSPKAFFRRFYPALITAFTTSSSNATIPVTLKQCTEEVGIDPKIASFSIPLGATINMDGCCELIVISLLFIAKIFDITIPIESYFSLGFIILAVSAGAPGVYGGVLVYLTAILPMIGAPAEAVTLIIILNTFIDRTITMTNITGDAVVSVLVAHSEGLLKKKN